MSDLEIKRAIDIYLKARNEILRLGDKHPDRIGGNDNIIGRIGEFFALQFLEGLGQHPRKVSGASNPGYDLIDGKILTQVKVITAENKNGRSVRLNKPWNQFILIELDKSYKPVNIGILSECQHQQALRANSNWSENPYVKITMLGPKGLIGKYGKVYSKQEIGSLMPVDIEQTEIFKLALDLFEGNKESADKWLNTPLKVLEHKTPLEYADTVEHANEVKALIQGLEHSVFQ